jgi:hypothetical protein
MSTSCAKFANEATVAVFSASLPTTIQTTKSSPPPSQKTPKAASLAMASRFSALHVCSHTEQNYHDERIADTI